MASYYHFLVLKLLLSGLLFMSIRSRVDARHLLETTLDFPELPVPTLPKVELPPLPEFPFSLPEPESPDVSEPGDNDLPEDPDQPELPLIPHLPELPYKPATTVPSNSIPGQDKTSHFTINP
ncbi:hypothetical protein K2173_009097 [Erythroxylum novogranatense]|uniref:Uncharacterized protein n=1 Tax=Erythroxylum novogranatense TaxID=1862640 RepID=A0AAV8TDF9_9ROSI|nr:hypothetical protein K2173_009097 [Erythroxylum novogranatense]